MKHRHEVDFLQMMFQVFVTLVAISNTNPSLGAERVPPIAPPDGLHPRSGVSRYVNWLPPDTESLLVVSQSYEIPASIEFDEMTVATELAEFCVSSLLLSVGRDKVAGTQVSLCIAGARKFRSRDGLGMLAFEGCQIIVLSDAAKSVDRVLERAIRDAEDSDRISGYLVAAIDSDVAQTGAPRVLAVRLSENVFVTANNRKYLTELLFRARQKPSERLALPASLVEWNAVSVASQCWGIRHYDRRPEAFTGDPTSPFAIRPNGFRRDPQAVGFAVSLTNKQKQVDVTHWSSNPKADEQTLRLWGAGTTQQDVMLDKSVMNGISFKLRLSGKITAPSDSSFLLAMLEMLGYGIAI